VDEFFFMKFSEGVSLVIENNQLDFVCDLYYYYYY